MFCSQCCFVRNVTYNSLETYLFDRSCYFVSLRKQPTFGDATTGFHTKWRLRNERRSSILMTRHYLDLGSASDWLNQISHEARPITQIYNPEKKSLGQYCNFIFLSFLGSVLKQCFSKFSCSSPSPHPIQSWNSKKILDTRVQHCLWGEGRGWTCVNWKTPRNA